MKKVLKVRKKRRKRKRRRRSNQKRINTFAMLRKWKSRNKNF
jgi:hypothetical protein